MKLVRHETAESLLASFWHLEEEGLTLEEFLQSEMGGQTAKGEDVTFKGEDELRGIKENGFWGYCDPKTKEVNVWVGEDADPAEIIFFLAHEIGHASGKPAEPTGDELKDEVAEEERADEYGSVAKQAYEWLKELSA